MAPRFERFEFSGVTSAEAGGSRVSVTEGEGQVIPPEVQSLIDRLELAPHPEGGWYREVWRSPRAWPVSALPASYSGPRSAMTSILFLLPTGMKSALHRVRSEELWLHHQGDDLALGIGSTQDAANDAARRQILGPGPLAALQVIVPAENWQKAEALSGPAGFALVGCVVAPGFDFDDFEMA